MLSGMTRLPLYFFSATVLLACSGVSPVADAQNLDAQRAQLKAVIDNAERGQFDPAQAAALSRHPLYGWVEFANLRRNIDTVSNAQAQDFLKRYNGQAVATSFRSVWLPAVARRQDWPTLLATNWTDTSNVGLRCAQLNARQATGKADAQWVTEAQAIDRALQPTNGRLYATDPRGALTPLRAATRSARHQWPACRPSAPPGCGW